MNKINESVGVIETFGLSQAILCADIAVKSANVRLIGYEYAKGSGLVAIKIAGDIGAVQAAIDAAKVEMSARNNPTQVLIIPRPDAQIAPMINRIDSPNGKKQQSPEKKSNSKKTTLDIETIDEDLIIETVDATEIEENSDESIAKTATCNLCEDPKCPRKRGEPHVNCIHYHDK